MPHRRHERNRQDVEKEEFDTAETAADTLSSEKPSMVSRNTTTSFRAVLLFFIFILKFYGVIFPHILAVINLFFK